MVSLCEERLDQLLRLVIEKESAVEQVDADDAERLLLQRGLGVDQAHVDDDARGLVARAALELDAHPAMAVVVAAKGARGHGIGEREEGGGVAARVAEALAVELVLEVEHRLQAHARNVALGVPVDGVADRHVVGRDALGDGAGRAADAEEPAHDLLAGADLRKGAVEARVEVDLERLVVGIGRGALHEEFRI